MTGRTINQLAQMLPATMSLLFGPVLWLAPLPIQASDGGDTSAAGTIRLQHVPSAMTLAGTTTADARASASASSSSSSRSGAKGGDCTAESSASAQARAGDEYQEDHDSDRQSSPNGDCQASSQSKATAGTNNRSSDERGEPGAR